MEYLFLGKNDYVPQPVPGELKELVNLKELSLDHSNLQGEIPTWIEGLSHLTLIGPSQESTRRRDRSD